MSTPAMEDAHTLSIDNHVNLASRASVAEADAFMRPFNLSIESKSDGSVQILYFHRGTRRCYRVIATSLEMEEDPGRNWLQQLTDLFPWTTEEDDEVGKEQLSGRLLGDSGRVDMLQGCDIRKALDMESGQSPKVDDLALVLCHPNGPLGALGKLPNELRDEVYKHAFPRTFWQCYHTKRPGMTLLGMSHSSRLPGTLNISKAIRKEALASAYSDRSLVITIGTEVIAFNFPLHPNLQAGQTLDSTQARLPKSAEMFIGIQVPSPRSSLDAAVRGNVGRIVALLNSIALNQILPPIRVSFKTNQETGSLQYYASDFEALLGPLADLRLGGENSGGKAKQPLVIDRLPPYSSSDGRDGFCDGIEKSVRTPPAMVPS